MSLSNPKLRRRTTLLSRFARGFSASRWLRGSDGLRPLAEGGNGQEWIRARGYCAYTVLDGAAVPPRKRRGFVDMAVSRCFQHDDCDGGRWSERIQAHYPHAQRIAENIAAGQDSAGAVVESWMRSEVHRANILRPEWQGTGISLVSLPGSPYGHYWTQTFGTLPAPVPMPMPERMSRSSAR